MPRSHQERQVLQLAADGRWDDAASVLAQLHPADIADIIDSASPDAHQQLFMRLPDDVKPDVLSELEDAAENKVVGSLTDQELAEIAEDMEPDDAADLLGELPSERADDVLSLMEEAESDEVRGLLQYDEESAGGIMTPEVFSLPGHTTVQDAIGQIAYFESEEPFFHAYVIGDDGTLTGHLGIWQLLRERDRSRKLSELIHGHTAAATVDMDQEEVARLMSKYDLAAIPVTDAEGRLVGRVTGDDVLDVMEEEASEDIFRLAGSDDVELEHSSIWRSCMVRLPWLLVTLLGGVATSFILRQFVDAISGILVLSAFVPVVLAMGGNTGIQSSTLLVRSIAIDGSPSHGIFRMLIRELTIGLLMGLACGLLIGAWAHFFVAHSTAGLGVPPLRLATTVGIALCSAMSFAALFGAAVPVLLDRMKIDPAVASGPFITIANDISALLIYFGTTVALLR